MSIYIKEYSSDKQLVINIIASAVTFVVNLCITFFLTPFIVNKLGSEAYGFIKLSADIISYTQLVTIALNSMAGRFITVSYTSGDVESANKYFSSVYYSNLILCVLLSFSSLICVVWLDCFFNIPQSLMIDVKLLFGILSINNIINLLFGTWSVSTFIKNRLDLSNIRGIVGNLIKAFVLLFMFVCLKPHIWYMGFAGFLMSIYIAYTNVKLSALLTPDLRICYKYVDLQKIKELLIIGSWNLINKLNNILEYGLDLLLANWFLGATYMGIFALTKNLPFLILSLFQIIASVFAPLLTQYYAQNQKEEMLSYCLKSIRILSFVSVIPITLLWVWGDNFYELWLPDQDAILLQKITFLSTIIFIVAMPLESLWHIFTITKRLKYPTITMFISSFFTILILILSMFVTDSNIIRLYILASTRSIIGAIRSFIFLPIYGAYCLELPKKIFYRPVFKSIAATFFSLLVTFVLKYFYNANTWVALGMIGLVTILISITINSIVLLNTDDRDYVKNKLTKLIKNNTKI